MNEPRAVASEVEKITVMFSSREAGLLNFRIVRSTVPAFSLNEYDVGSNPTAIPEGERERKRERKCVGRQKWEKEKSGEREREGETDRQ